VRAVSEDSSAIFAGTSGQTVVHYIDDTPNRLTSKRSEQSTSNAGAIFENLNLTPEEATITGTQVEDRDIILYASFDTSKFPVTISDDNITRFELLRQNYFQIYETQKVGLPVSVKYLNPQKLSLTTTGIPEPGFDLSAPKFLNSPMPLVIRTCDDDQNIINTDYLPQLSSRWSATSQNFSGGDMTTDTLTSAGFVTLYLSGTDSTFTQLDTPYNSEEDFQVWDAGTTFPEEEANRHIRLLVADRKTKQPIPVDTERHPGKMRTVTLLFSEITQEQQSMLLSTEMSAHMYGSGQPRNWFLQSGEIYYGYVLPKSNYKQKDSIDLQLKTINESFTTPGSIMMFVNLYTDVLDYKSDKNRYRFYAHTLLEPPETFTYEVVYYYLTNPANDTLWQLKPVYYREYSYGTDGTTQTYTAPISTTSPGNSGMYGIAVEPLGDVIAVDGDTDKIIRYWRNVSERAEFSIRDVMPESIRSNHWPDNPDAYGYTPSSVSLDSNLDYWVAMYDTVSAVKFSGETNMPIAYAVPPVVNFLADSRTTNPSSHWSLDAQYQINPVTGRPGEYGENIINPTAVETCENNDVIVTYSNPLCSFIARYDPQGEFLYKYEFPGEDRYFTGDVCVDVSDHAWAVTESTGLDHDGMPIDTPISMLYSFDEQLNLRYSVSSLEGTSFQDMLKPQPHKLEEVDMIVNMSQEYDYEQQEYFETAMLVVGYGGEQNPRITLYEGNIYHFENQYFNRGQHVLKFQHISPLDENLPLSATHIEYDLSMPVMERNVVGHDSSRTSIYIDADTPTKFLLVDQNYKNTIGIIIDVVKKPVIGQRPAETFKYMNNASFVIPDNKNNIWVSWGSRFVSRWNPLKFKFDTTVAVGSAYEHPGYDPMDVSTHNRRTNNERRSAIEGLACDTANNLLVIQNHDKNVYALNSDVPAVSAFINIANQQPDATEFSWIESLCSSKLASQDDFMLYPDSYMTREQIASFLEDNEFTGTEQQKAQAYQNYLQTINSNQAPLYRTNHGLNPLTAVGFESEICAFGDWTGYKWISKYDNRVAPSDRTSGFVTLAGESEEFTLLPQSGTHQVVKINEANDFAGVLRSFMKQPGLMNSTKLYNEFNDAVFGTKHSSIHSLGKKVYERIANYVINTSDVDTCTIECLYGMASMVNHKLKTIGYAMPVEMQRLVDLLSINFTKLRGTPISEKQDFDKLGNWNQDAYGVNLGPELIFVYDWMPKHGYITGDYTYYQNEYYECVSSPGEGIAPGTPASRKFWRHIKHGMVKTLSERQAKRKYDKLTPDQLDKFVDFEQYYHDEVPIRAKLIQNLNVKQNVKYVLQEEHTGEYELVQARTLRFEDGKVYKLQIQFPENQPAYISITNPNLTRPLQSEHMALLDTQSPIYTQHDDGTLTLIGSDVMNSNKTIVLIQNRTYRFEIDSIEHPIIITEHPGVDAQPTPFVNDQYVEFGKIIIKTDVDTIHGDFPSRLYYQSVNDPKISGTILIKSAEEIPGYSTLVDGLTSYNINLTVNSHHDLDGLGWGLSFPEGANAWQYYSIYEYVEPRPTQVKYNNSIIDWQDTETTIDYMGDGTNTGDVYDQWYKRNGLGDVMIEKTLRRGLGLFDGMKSIE
jgi:hypothetical protein